MHSASNSHMKNKFFNLRREAGALEEGKDHRRCTAIRGKIHSYSRNIESMAR